jgi:YVTN family beta-propeller protein
MNHNAIYSPDGSEIWTAQMSSPGSVLVLDAITLETRQTIAVGEMPAEVTFTRDGKYAFVCNGMSGDVSVIDVASYSVQKTIAVGTTPVGAWPGRGSLMYVDNETSKSISAIDSATLEVVRTYDLGFTPASVGETASGEVWVTDTDAGKVVFYAAGTTDKSGELATGEGAHAMAFSADGKTAYITNQLAGTLSVIDVESRQLTGTVEVGSKPNGLLFRAR